ncbi:AAA family ATPase [Lederbergia citri]|uniref:AAA family ATPase n=1 Tax=Lederbergia citri TaxID=2833580 RepID=A0A942YGH0_9BACI|nr:AAA family ATPase [Lederbergia citri]MBS4196143.1 AAA family ATPase [Lederbergia citri]
MVKIFSMAENDEVISKLEEVSISLGCEVGWATNEYKLFDLLKSSDNGIVVLPPSDHYDVYALCRNVTQRFPQSTVLFVFPSERDPDMKQVLRAGAADVIFLTSSLAKIKEDIQLAISNREFNRPFPVTRDEKNAKVITVASTKGGVGKTTVAVNLAASFGKKFEKVAVIDLDLQFGDIAMFMDVKPKLTIYDWIKEDLEGLQIDNFLTPFKNGISILAAPQRPEFAEVITGNHVRKAIHVLKKQYDIVIIDVSCHMDENVIVALENSDEILVMTYFDLPTLKNSKMLIETLESLQLVERTKLILNRQMKVKGITSATVEKVVGKKIFAALPTMEKKMIASVNEGQPLFYLYPRSKLAKNFRKIAESLVKPEVRIGAKKQKARKLVQAGGHA